MKFKIRVNFEVLRLLLLLLLLLLIFSDKGVKSGFHWLRVSEWTTSCLEKARSVLHFTFAPWSIHLQHIITIIITIIIIIIIIISMAKKKIFSVFAEFVLWELSIVSSLSLYSILVQHACNDHAWLTSKCSPRYDNLVWENRRDSRHELV